ncbi:MAG: DUF559 domain-containing protein [Ornithinibacter sp.]
MPASPLRVPTAPFLTRDGPTLGVSRRRLATSEFRPVFTGVSVAALVPDTVVVRAKAALLLAPEGAVASHWTAARIWGGVVPDNDWTHISFMRDVRFRVRGVKHHRFRHRLDIRRWQGLPVTSPCQTFCHLARHLGLVDLVALGDRLVKKGRCTPSDLVSYADAWPGQCREDALRGARLVRDGVDSVPETALRLLMALAGLPEPQVNIPILDAEGNVRFRIDLGFEEVKLAIEYDGRWHDAEEQREHDTWRRGILGTEEGWTFVVVRSEELYEQPEELLQRLVSELRAQGIGVPPALCNGWRHHYRMAWVAA